MECEEIYLKIEESVFTPSSGSEDFVERVDRLTTAIKSLESLIDSNPSDSRYWALLGVARYFLLGLTEDVDRKSIRAALNKALALDPQSFYAKLYLAYQCFDEEDHAQALSLIQKVLDEDCGRLAAWTQLKLRELSIVCRISMDAETVSVNELIAFNELWSTTDEDDRTFPEELCRALKLDAMFGRE